MKAIIMAGGEGSRLRPTTCTLPKPMVRILDVPVMECAVRLLARHGVQQIAVTLKYLPDPIREYFGDGSRFGVTMHWYEERESLGTAGGVKLAEEFLGETFLVLSGDGLTDCDLGKAVEFHRRAGAEATLVTVRAQDPREYGVVCAGEDGRVTRFQEKPDWSDVRCDRVNAGIYVLEPSALSKIPADAPYDFSRDLFPKMLTRGDRLYAWEADCYWCDIGDIPALLGANWDALAGRVSLLPMPEDGVLVHPTARIADGARLEPPVCVGAGAVVDSGALVGEGSVIGARCRVEAGASLRRCVLMPEARVEPDAQLRGCLIGEGARVRAGAQIYEGAAVGAGCVVGRGAELMQGVRVWPEKSIPDRMRLRDNVMWGHAAQAAFHMGAVECFSPERAAQCAQALCAAMKPRIVLIAHGGSAVAAAQHRAACAGLMAQGAQVYDCRGATLMELRAMLRHVGAGCACYVTADSFYPLTSGGVALTGDERRQFLSALNRGCPAPYADVTHPIQLAGRSDLIYLRATVSDELIRRLSGFCAPVAVYARYEQLLSLAERAFLRAGLSVRAEWEEEMMELAPGEVGVWLSDTGESARLFTADGELSEAEMQLLTAQTLLEAGEKRLILPDDATYAVEPLAERYRARVERVPGGASQWAARLSLLSPRQLPAHFDGIHLALHALAMLNRLNLSLSDFCRSAPVAIRSRRTVEIPEGARARTLERLNRALNPDEPGRFHMTRDDAHAWILPSEEDGRCTVLAEAADVDMARELCDFYERAVRAAMADGPEAR